MSDYNLGLMVGALTSISPALLLSGIIIGTTEPKRRRLAGILSLLGGVSILSAYMMVRTLQ